MSKIVPQIKSGDLLLLVNETICFDSSQGISLTIPTFNTDTKLQTNITFKFIFEYGKFTTVNEFNTSVQGNMFIITIQNFGITGIYSGLLTPLSFKIGTLSMSLYFAGQTIPFNDDKNRRLISLAISIYQGEVK